MHINKKIASIVALHAAHVSQANGYLLPIYCPPASHVGVCYHRGALPTSITEACTFYNPFLDSCVSVKTELDLDVIEGVDAVSKNDIPVRASITVGNKILKGNVLETLQSLGPTYDRTAAEFAIAIFKELASEYTASELRVFNYTKLDNDMETRLQAKLIEKGIKVIIVLVRIGNVQVPQWVQDNAIKMQQQKDAAAIAIEEAKKANIIKQTEAANAAADNQRNIDRIHAEQAMAAIEARGKADQDRINATSGADVMRIETDAAAARARQMIEIQRVANDEEVRRQRGLLEIPGYKDMVSFQAINNNAKFYYGEGLPKIAVTSAITAPVV